MTYKERSFVAFCPHCGNRARQKVLCEHDYTTERYGETVDPWGTRCEALFCACDTCDEVLLYDGVHPYDGGTRTLVHPQDTVLHLAVPEVVRSNYEESARVRANAPNAYAVMIRRSLEALCEDRGANRGPLVARLRELADRGEFPPVLEEVTDLLRRLGNAAAHDFRKSLTPEQTRAVDQFFRVLVEYVYVAPFRLAEFKEALAQSADDDGSEA